MTKKKDNRGGAGRNQGRKKRAETSTFTIRTRIEWLLIVKQAAKDKETELKALEHKAIYGLFFILVFYVL